jgi:hypothetical protein
MLATLFSHQRSGSHFFKSVLESRYRRASSGDGTFKQLVAMPELLCPTCEDWTDPTGLLIYRDFLQSEKAGPAPSWIDRDAHATVFDRYIDDLESKSADRMLLLDIKFNQTHLANGWYCRVGGPPDAVRKLHRRGPIVILRRRNLVLTQVSNMTAWETRIWHHCQCEESSSEARRAANRPSVRLDPEYLYRMVEILDLECCAVERWFQNSEPSVAYVWYEDLFDPISGEYNSAEFERIARFLGLGVGEGTWKSPFRKIGGRSLADSVANAEEIRAVFRGTKYEAMAI